MKIVFAPDKFKSCMTAPEVCASLESAFREIFPNAELVSLPMADGGDGTMEAIVSAAHGEIRSITVLDPLGRKTSARFGVIRQGKTAVIEMASASGIALLKREELDPLNATTYGTGEMILAALKEGVSEIILGIGGSATVDGGAGMAQALGYRLLDKNGHDLPFGGGALCRLAEIDCTGADPRLLQTKIRVACDVTSPLLGPQGAARVFGPQKGADPAGVEILEQNLSHLADVWRKKRMIDSADEPGDGAAGGLGAGLRAFCHARPESGADLVMDILEFKKHLSGASFVITGEGCTDSQTGSGKLCGKIADAAHARHIPVLLLSGSLCGKPDVFYPVFDYAFSISPGRTVLDEALKNGPEDLRNFAVNLARLIRDSQRGFFYE